MEDDEDKPRVQEHCQGWVLLLTMCAAGIGGTFQYGYNLTIINAPTFHIQKFVNETWLERSGSKLDSWIITLIWSIIVSVYPLGGFLGALLAGPMAIKLGRCQHECPAYVPWRKCPQEAPWELLGSEETWPLLLASNVIPAVLQVLVLPWLPESPRYLLIDLKDRDSCVSALQRLRGHCNLSDEMEEMLAEQAAIKGQKPKNLLSLVQDPLLRRQLLTIVVLSSAMQLCGNDSMYFYASYIFNEAGIPPEKIPYVVIGTGSCELITSLTCTLFIDRVGRRALVMGGYSMMSVWAVVFMVALSQQEKVSWMPYLSMVCIFAYILSFGIGPAGVTGIMPAEIFDQMARPAAYMICGSLIWIMLFIVGLAFPFIVQGLGHFCYLPFMVVCVSTAVYVRFFLPETKGKSLLEITEEFAKHRAKSHEEQNGWIAPMEIKSTML
ncbi:solute carrier family 2, facilitated glucose transporter member 11 isoform X2 [Aquarana catesbeiana]|uniref:solute carrier family 2, facilitated glucose transporter member 11 isoform X2 n=1 Tax=Aquarana catesbeiana TaxID=8400 RepID=UPI003CC99D8D